MSLHPVLNFTVTSDDVLCVCPYDSSHKVLQPRLSRHLVKCRGAYLKEILRTKGKPEIGICKWNSNHHIFEKILHDHELNCPDRECMTDHLRYHANPEFKLPGPSPAAQIPIYESKTKRKGPMMQTKNIDEESWESAPVHDDNKVDREPVGVKDTKQFSKNSVSHTMYDPTTKLMREPIIYTPQGLTKSELKRHRQDEHSRWKKLKLHKTVFNKAKDNEEMLAAEVYIEEISNDLVDPTIENPEGAVIEFANPE